MTDAPEFSRPFDVRQAEGKSVRLEAREDERAALAKRFGLVAIARLEAEIAMTRKGRKVEAEGTLRASWTQPCAISAEDIPVAAEEPVRVRFIPAARKPLGDIDAELDQDPFDEIDYQGTHVDLGEAVAQTFGLSIDPYLTGPEAETARSAAGGLGEPEDAGPFAALKGLAPRD